MFLLDDQQKFVIFYTILWILLGVLFVAAIVLFILRLIRIHKKGVKAEREEIGEAKEKFLDAFGGKENIKDSSYELSRVTVEVVDVDQVNGEVLKELGATGVLFVGNKVKCSFKEDAENICELLK